MLGWTIEARLQANISDWVQATMITAGEWGKGKAPKHTQEYRPWTAAKKRAKESEGVEISKLYSLFAAKAAGQGR